ncbi:MAG TPA: hypothetical protein VIJ95_02860 [Hanamia sp.]
MIIVLMDDQCFRGNLYLNEEIASCLAMTEKQELQKNILFQKRILTVS